MRSYIMSLTLVACVLGGYTAAVITLNKPSTAAENQKPHANQAETDSREPASKTTSID
jgi:hypothetical protein